MNTKEWAAVRSLELTEKGLEMIDWDEQSIGVYNGLIVDIPKSKIIEIPAPDDKVGLFRVVPVNDDDKVLRAIYVKDMTVYKHPMNKPPVIDPAATELVATDYVNI